MKIVLREWVKFPRYLAMVIVETLMAIVDIYLVTETSKLAAMVFDTRGDMDILRIFVLFMVVAIVINQIRKYSKNAIHRFYTEEFDRITDTVLNREFNMFIDFSCSRIISITERMYNIAGAIMTLADMVVMIVKVFIITYAIYGIMPQLVVPLLAIWGIVAIILRVVYNSWNRIDKAADELKRQRNSEYDAIVNGFKEVRGFSMEERHRAHMYQLNHDVMLLFIKRNKSSMLINGIYRTVHLVVNVLGLLYCLSGIRSGTLTVAFAMVIYNYINEIGRPIEVFLDLIDDMSIQLSQIDEFDRLMKYEDRYVQEIGTMELDVFEREIVISDVSFSYSSASDVLDGINMVIPKGAHIGVCGASGGGKTTLMNLLMRYYDPQSGMISIDGIPYSEINARSLRSKIGIVNQDVYIFDQTIRYNVLYGKPSATEAELIEACKKANIYEFIKEQPDGFDTNVGPKGLKLSGGQKQRIGLARLFLYDPEIILLDEATASLDNDSERLVQEAMTLFDGKTIVTIAHRLSTIRDSDIIYVIDKHHVVEQGTHEELMMIEDGIYRRLNKKTE